MSVIINGKYLGTKRLEMTHEPSGAVLITDAPKDNAGEGQSFSPTDLVGTALASCMLTTMAILTERDGMDLTGMSVQVVKDMEQAPRRIGKLTVDIHLPKKLSVTEREKLEKIAHTCPVSRSLSPEVKVDLTFIYDFE